jgi:hypothetical protein
VRLTVSSSGLGYPTEIESGRWQKRSAETNKQEEEEAGEPSSCSPPPPPINRELMRIISSNQVEGGRPAITPRAMGDLPLRRELRVATRISGRKAILPFLLTFVESRQNAQKKKARGWWT